VSRLAVVPVVASFAVMTPASSEIMSISTECTENYRHLCEWRHAKTGCEMVAIVSRLAVVPVVPWLSVVPVVPWLAVVPVMTPALIKPAFLSFPLRALRTTGISVNGGRPKQVARWWVGDFSRLADVTVVPVLAVVSSLASVSPGPCRCIVRLPERSTLLQWAVGQRSWRCFNNILALPGGRVEWQFSYLLPRLPLWPS
jgi:hypothetical protein